MTLACGHLEEVFAGSESRWVGELCDACQQLEARRARHRARQADLAGRRAGAGIPEAYHGAGVDELRARYGDSQLFDECARWVLDGNGLYLYGTVGAGKTTAAAAAAWDLLDRTGVTWVRASQLSRWALGAFGSEEYLQAQKIAGTSGPLVIDDLGEEPTSEGAAMVLRDAIQNRIDAGRPLLVTSNLSIDEVTVRNEQLGHRFASRLHGYCRIVRVADVDHRRRR